MKTAGLWVIGIILFIATVSYVGLSDAGSCEDIAAGVKSNIVTHSKCSVDSDCKKLRLACPFDCDVSVNAVAVEEVLASVNAYNRSCMMVCPECPKGSSSAAKCVDSMCSS